jgi:hypothetical protein
MVLPDKIDDFCLAASPHGENGGSSQGSQGHVFLVPSVSITARAGRKTFRCWTGPGCPQRSSTRSIDRRKATTSTASSAIAAPKVCCELAVSRWLFETSVLRKSKYASAQYSIPGREHVAGRHRRPGGVLGSFDHLVDAGEERWRKVEAACPCDLQID